MKTKLLKLLKMNNCASQEIIPTRKKLCTNIFALKIFFVMLISSFSISGISQTVESQERVLNLPPDYFLSPKAKAEATKDLSYKLAEIPKAEPQNFKSTDFFKNVSKEKLDYYEANEPEKLQYFITAKKFYDDLSNKVKVVFTIEELWYIYYFDQKLKSTLQAVK